MSGQSESTWRLSPGTAKALAAGLLVAGIWLGTIQAQVTSFRSEVAASKSDHAALMTKLEQVDARIVDLKVALEKERTRQGILHRGQLPDGEK